MRFEVLNREHLDQCADALVQAYKDDPWTPERAKELLNNYIGSPGFLGFVVYDNDMFVGAVFCREMVGAKRNRIVIDELFILPEMQKKGFGNALLDLLRHHVRKNELSGIFLMTERSNPAIEFYEKSGFVRNDNVAFLSEDSEDR
ncbi:MAG: GNAT family N-acetyltransferase [Clostridiaceae bacterium]|nr:GNAT family N-acetyltransferase [Clostridiaceae bacterium]